MEASDWQKYHKWTFKRNRQTDVENTNSTSESFTDTLKIKRVSRNEDS